MWSDTHSSAARMSEDNQNIIVQLAVLTGTQTRHSDRIKKLETRDEKLNAVLVAVGKIEMQIKLMMGLLMLVIGGLVSVAISLLK